MADTTIKWARSTMTGAPTLAGQVGSLVSLLDALLVNGWGSATATSVVVAGGVATATFPANHAAAIESVVAVAGITGTYATMNGEQKITATGANTISWETGLANGTAAGTVTVKMAGAGFAIPFTGTNLRAYKSSSPQSHGQFLRVNDTSAQFARVVGYETMSAISTGTGLFPSAAQVNGGYWWGKSSAASATAAPWVFASDGRAFYLFVAAATPANGAAYTSCVPMFFGDLAVRAPAGDPFATGLLGAADSAWANSGAKTLFTTAIDTGMSVPRSYGGSGSSFRGSNNLRNTDPGTRYLPNPIDGSMELCPVIYRDGNLGSGAFPRAEFPGLLVSIDMGVDKFYPNGTLLKVDGSPTSRILSHGKDGIDGYTEYMCALLLDISGKWR